MYENKKYKKTNKIKHDEKHKEKYRSEPQYKYEYGDNVWKNNTKNR